jgi:prevent-host-death family protein
MKGKKAMKTAAIANLKARLSDYLNQVKSGTEVLVTDRGKPVARIIPVSGKTRTRGALQRMEKQGLIKLGSGRLPRDFWTRSRAKDPQGLVLQAFLEEREQGR